MKYLKLFDSHQDKLWQEIDKSQLVKYLFGGEPDGPLVDIVNRETDYCMSVCEDFTDLEIQKIMQFFPNYDHFYLKMTKYLPRAIRGNNDLFPGWELSNVINKGAIGIVDSDGNDILQIFKVQDEWFYVSDERFLDTYYKCDQFDGLIEFLESNFRFLEAYKGSNQWVNTKMYYEQIDGQTFEKEVLFKTRKNEPKSFTKQEYEKLKSFFSSYIRHLYIRRNKLLAYVNGKRTYVSSSVINFRLPSFSMKGFFPEKSKEDISRYVSGFYSLSNPIKPGSDHNLNIYKMDDEWFYLAVGGWSGGWAKYYKCDQFEGLMKLLEDKFKYLNENHQSSQVFESNESEYYQEIDRDILNSEINPYRRRDLKQFQPDSFTKEEFEKIESFFHNHKNVARCSYVESSMIEVTFSDVKFIPQDTYLIIYKMTDEWFYTDSNVDKGFHPALFHKVKNRYYKCDQIEGLMKFLEDNFKWVVQ